MTICPSRRNRKWALGVASLLVLSGLAFPRVSFSQELGTPDWLRDHLGGTAFSHRRDNGKMMELVSPLSDQAGRATVQVLADGRPVALGAMVSTDGYLVTKRSELSNDPLRVRLPDGRLFSARIAAVRRVSDLALLKVEGTDDLPVVSFSDEEPDVGCFLVTSGRGDVPVGIGVMGVSPRKVDHVGRLGVILRNDRAGRARVDGVWPDSGADKAGVLPGDRIVAINGKNEEGDKQVISALKGMYPGETVRLTIQRDDGELEIDAQIRDFSVMQESPNDSRVNGARSTRLSGFERVLQHDTVLEPHECGGPVVDCRGRVVGLNIARAGRVVSYALPGALVNQELRLMLDEARRLAPAPPSGEVASGQ